MSIPLDPGPGGRSIEAAELNIADIVLSTTSERISRLIRYVTKGPVSHSMLYIGDDLVVEAVEAGVVCRPLTVALNGAILGVAYRHPSITEATALIVRDVAGYELGKKYNLSGAVRSDNPYLCRMVGTTEKFFCSQLVVHAFQRAGVSLTVGAPHCSTPADIAEVAVRRLTYVGHLLA